MQFPTARMNWEGTVLNEVSQTEKHKYCMFLLMCELQKIKRKPNDYNKTESDSQTDTENKPIVKRGRGGEGRTIQRKGIQVSKIQGYNVPHKEYNKYFIITLNGV